MRKRFVLLFVLLMLMLSGCGDSASYTIDRVEMKAAILPDGDLYVQELFTYTFEGKWRGSTRYIQTEGHQGVEFFEAYLPPGEGLIGDFTYDHLERLQVQWDDDNDTYYAYTASEDETKRIYYRYRIDQAAVRYTDTGELDWRFLMNNKTDLENVSIDLVFPQGDTVGRVNYYLRDRTGGEVSLVKGGIEEPSHLHYTNESLSEYGDARIRVLFPAEWLDQLKAGEEALPLAEALAEEQAREQKIADRAEIYPALENSIVALVLLTALTVLFFLLPPRRIAAFLRRKELPPSRLELMDPLLGALLYRKGRLKKQDIFAGVFSLHQRGMVTMQQSAALPRFLRDPAAPDVMPRFRFAGTRRHLNPADRFLVDQFFRNSGNSFLPESISGPTKLERKSGADHRDYRKKALSFAEKFKKWSRLVGQEKEYHAYIRPNSWKNGIRGALIVLHFFVVLALYYADAASWQACAIAGAALTAGGILTLVFQQRKWLSYVYIAACLIAATQLTDSEALSHYLLLVLVTLILLPLIPAYTFSPEGAQYRSALKAWRRRLKKGEIDSAACTEDAVIRSAEFALILDAGGPFLTALKKTFEKDSLNPSLDGIDTGLYAMNSYALFSGLLYSRQAVTYMPPDSSSSSGSDYSSSSHSDSGGGGDSGGTGAF